MKKQDFTPQILSGAKILVIDIELAPTTAFVWRLFKENVGLEQIQDDWFIMSYSAKWLNEKKIFYNDQHRQVQMMPPESVVKSAQKLMRDKTKTDEQKVFELQHLVNRNYENDRQLLLEMKELLDHCDIAVAHNGRKFDIPKINSRLLLNDIQRPSPYKIVDTLDIAKKHFGFTSNKLAYLSEKICPENAKLKHSKFPGFALWKECLSGNPAAWKEMEKYNKQDVISLEQVYLKMRPFHQTHPNLGVYAEQEGHVCSKCGGTHLQSKGYTYTSVGKYKIYVCKDCGGYSRYRFTEYPKDLRRDLLTSS